MRMKNHQRLAAEIAIGLALAVIGGCSKKPADTAPKPRMDTAATALSASASASSSVPTPSDAGIAWRHVDTNAEVDDAFALAKADRKPVFVYWGASWCPPCNQVKATLFNRQDFIQRSRAFVPVYVDGDSPGAQRLGARFKVRGYPTMVLFNPDGAEVTRLPGEVEARQYTEVLTLGLDARTPVKQIAAAALAGGASAQALTANDWRLLSFYSWETDEQQVVEPAGRPQFLKRLAAACPPESKATATRLMLVAASADDKSADVDDDFRARLSALLADPAAAQAQMDVLANNASALVKAASRAGSPERAQLLVAFDGVLQRFERDASLSRADRMTALVGRVGLARIDLPSNAIAGPMPAPLLDDLRTQAAHFDREITDGYERQAVITTAAEALQDAGLGAESDALLKANLAKSHSPFYLMSDLSLNAKKRGDNEQALYWSKEAFNTSMGPATRLQWGALYVDMLIELSPRDEDRIEHVAQQVFDEAGGQSGAFYERSARSMQKVGKKLQAWNKGRAHQAVIERLQARLDGVCERLSGADATTQRAVCDGVMKAEATAKLQAKPQAKPQANLQANVALKAGQPA